MRYKLNAAKKKQQEHMIEMKKKNLSKYIAKDNQSL